MASVIPSTCPGAYAQAMFHVRSRSVISGGSLGGMCGICWTEVKVSLDREKRAGSVNDILSCGRSRALRSRSSCLHFLFVSENILT